MSVIFKQTCETIFKVMKKDPKKWALPAFVASEIGRDLNIDKETICLLELHNVGKRIDHLTKHVKCHKNRNGIIHYDILGCQYLLQCGFPTSMCLQLQHLTDAQRYLCYKDLNYIDTKLSKNCVYEMQSRPPMTFHDAVRFEYTVLKHYPGLINTTKIINNANKICESTQYDESFINFELMINDCTELLQKTYYNKYIYCY